MSRNTTSYLHYRSSDSSNRGDFFFFFPGHFHTSLPTVVVLEQLFPSLKWFPFTLVHLVIWEDSNWTETMLRRRFFGPFANQSSRLHLERKQDQTVSLASYSKYWELRFKRVLIIGFTPEKVLSIDTILTSDKIVSLLWLYVNLKFVT